MAAKQPIRDVAKNYHSLEESFPDLPIDPQVWGSKALDLLSGMAKKGPLLRQTVSYLVGQDIQLYITREAKGVGAGWHETLSGERWISIDRSFGFGDSMIAVGHEALHLTQDIRTRCSVEGEYHAWRLGFKLRSEVSGGTAPMSADEQMLASMPENPSRGDLKAAQALMHKMAGPNYLIHWAPLSGETWTTVFLALAIKIVNSVAKRGDWI